MKPTRGEHSGFVHCLLFDTEGQFSEVVDYDLNGYDHTRLWKGKELDKNEGVGVRLTMSDAERRPDLMANPLSWLLCSQRLAAHLHERAPGCCQVMECNLVTVNGDQVEGYKLLNVLKVIDVLDLDLSDYDIEDGVVEMVYTDVFSAAKLPLGDLMFRDSNFIYRVFLTDSLARGLGGMTGFAFLECKVV